VSRVVFEQDDIRVDATLIADAFRIPPQTVLERIRAGQITTLSERGVDADAGRFRITFVLGAGRLRLLIDAEGNVIERSLVVRKQKEGAPSVARVNRASGETGCRNVPLSSLSRLARRW
jgi:hypothetical protein